MRATLAALAAALLVQLSGCGIPEDEERRRVLTELDRLREMPTGHPEEILKAAEALAAMPVQNDRTKQARDVCASMHIDRAKMYALKAELDAAVKGAELKGDPKVLADKYRLMDELQQGLTPKLDECSTRYGELLTAR